MQNIASMNIFPAGSAPGRPGWPQRRDGRALFSRGVAKRANPMKQRVCALRNFLKNCIQFSASGYEAVGKGKNAILEINYQGNSLFLTFQEQSEEYFRKLPATILKNVWAPATPTMSKFPDLG